MSPLFPGPLYAPIFTQVPQALTRLTPAEAYDRAYRLKRASQASVLHAPLPKEQWTPATEVSKQLLSLICVPYAFITGCSLFEGPRSRGAKGGR